MQIYQEISVFKFNPRVEFEASYRFKLGISLVHLALLMVAPLDTYVLLLTLKRLMN